MISYFVCKGNWVTQFQTFIISLWSVFNTRHNDDDRDWRSHFFISWTEGRIMGLDLLEI
jgi:hypothetical protein